MQKNTVRHTYEGKGKGVFAETYIRRRTQKIFSMSNPRTAGKCTAKYGARDGHDGSSATIFRKNRLFQGHFSV